MKYIRLSKPLHLSQMFLNIIIFLNQGCQEHFWVQGQKELPILQIMIPKLSPPRCVISKESAQQKWIDELWFRKQFSTCLFVWTLNYNDLAHLLNSLVPGRRSAWPLSRWACPEWTRDKLYSSRTIIIKILKQCYRHEISEILLKTLKQYYRHEITEILLKIQNNSTAMK